MKIINKITIPTTKKEKKILCEHKYTHIRNTKFGVEFAPQIHSITALSIEVLEQYLFSVFGDGEFNTSEDGKDLLWNGQYMPIPSNLELLVAYYRATGKHRKVARILRATN